MDKTPVANKTTYHHGDLRNALVTASARLAEESGTDAVTIRAVARAVGVTPTATYRHFTDRDELMRATRLECLDRMANRFLARIDEVPADLAPEQRAITRFMVTGRSYIEFALEEPNLYRTCMCPPGGTDGDLEIQPEDTAAYAMLTALLDEMVEAGAMDRASRPLAEPAAWAMVHGTALLLLDSALRNLSADEKDAVIDHALVVSARGLGVKV